MNFSKFNRNLSLNTKFEKLLQFFLKSKTKFASPPKSMFWPKILKNICFGANKNKTKTANEKFP